jgi:hypothetical protein
MEPVVAVVLAFALWFVIPEGNLLLFHQAEYPILSVLLLKGWGRYNYAVPVADSTKTFIAANETMSI